MSWRFFVDSLEHDLEVISYDDLDSLVSSEICLLSPGDVLLLYTDGVTETEGQISNNFYGEDRLINCFSKNLTRSAESLCDVLQTDLMEFSGTAQLKDDRAVVVLKRTDTKKTPT